MALCKCGCGGEAPLAARNRKDRGWVKGQPVNFIHGHNPVIPFPQRIMEFWSHTSVFPVNGLPDCIEWTGTMQSNGYGKFIRTLGEVAAHRIAYALTFGAISEGKELDHLCRNCVCVNPYHVEPVTRRVNVRRSARAKLTMEDVREIRLSKEGPRALGRRYGVAHTTIRAVLLNRTWT
jgi:HNH endonuclease